MRNQTSSITFLTALTLAVFLSQVPWSMSGQAQAEFTAPRAKYGGDRPDISGIWQALNTAHWDLQDHPAAAGPLTQLGAMFIVPPGGGVVEGGEIPYQPWALEKKQRNFERRIAPDPRDYEIGDPELKCYMGGVPRSTYMPYPFQIIQGENEIVIAYEFARANRLIHMAKHGKPAIDSWMGWSNGHWDKDTLVVEVTGLNGLAWLDRAGNFISENARLTERYTPISPHHLNYEVTIEDPTVFTRPWKIAMPLYRRIERNMQLFEVNCVEFAEEALYGSIRTEPKK